MAALTGGKGFPFLFQHIRDGINIRQTCNLIFSLCRYNNRLAEHVRAATRALTRVPSAEVFMFLPKGQNKALLRKSVAVFFPTIKGKRHKVQVLKKSFSTEVT